jgi:hypothetical protein
MGTDIILFWQNCGCKTLLVLPGTSPPTGLMFQILWVFPLLYRNRASPPAVLMFQIVWTFPLRCRNRPSPPAVLMFQIIWIFPLLCRIGLLERHRHTERQRQSLFLSPLSACGFSKLYFLVLCRSSNCGDTPKTWQLYPTGCLHKPVIQSSFC